MTVAYRASPFAGGPLAPPGEQAWEVAGQQPFQPVAVESPGGGRVRDNRDPAPRDCVTVQGMNGPVVLHRLAAEAWAAMVRAARADGIAAPLLLPISGYRSSQRQAQLWRTALARYGSPGEARKWVAPPGSSAHQSGRAIDFHLGARNDSRNVGALRGTRAYRWLVANAHRFGFYPYEREPWHWEYNPPATPAHRLASGPPGGVRAGRLKVPALPLLASHTGTEPALILRWNAMPPTPAEIDVVVHLHGYSRPWLSLPSDIEPISGLDLAPPAGTLGRSRPTLAVLPRGHFTGRQQRDGPRYVYTFPALDGTNGRKDGIARLIRFALDRFAATVRGPVPRVARLILTAHSGGGEPLLRILRFVDPNEVHEVHVYDALYGPPDALVAWARRHIAQDRAGSSARGAMRVFHGRGITARHSRALRDALAPQLTSALARCYRVEATTVAHDQMPRRFGRHVLADACADIPGAGP
jgi:hypothetical protein